MIRIKTKDKYLTFNAKHGDANTIDNKDDATILRNKPGYFLIRAYSSFLGKGVLEAEEVEKAFILSTQKGYLMKINDYGVPELTDVREEALLLSNKQYTILSNLLKNQGFIVEKETVE